MEAIAKFKQIGEKEWKDQRILVPDFCAKYLDRYDLQIVMYPMFDSMGIFFQKKSEPDFDVVSQTIKKPSISDNVALGFKAAFEQIEALESIFSEETTTVAGSATLVSDVVESGVVSTPVEFNASAQEVVDLDEK